MFGYGVVIVKTPWCILSHLIQSLFEVVQVDGIEITFQMRKMRLERLSDCSELTRLGLCRAPRTVPQATLSHLATS